MRDLLTAVRLKPDTTMPTCIDSPARKIHRSLYRRLDGLEIDTRLLAVRLHLPADHVVIRASGLHQFLVRPALDDPPLLHQQDEVGPTNGRQSVRDDERRPVGQKGGHRSLNELLALSVEVACRLVEDEYLR